MRFFSVLDHFVKLNFFPSEKKIKNYACDICLLLLKIIPVSCLHLPISYLCEHFHIICVLSVCLLDATSFFPPLIYQVAFSSYKSNNFGSSGGKFDYVSFDILEISAAAAAIPVPIFKVHAHLRKFKPSTTRSCTKKNRNDLHHYYSLHDAFISGSLSKVVHKKLGNKSVLHII